MFPEGFARLDDPEAVRREYADETGLSVRTAIWGRRSGQQPLDIAFDEVIAARPRRVLEVGCGRGEFAEIGRASCRERV